MFLATTAIDSFWDINRKIVFLGPWCLTPKNEHIWRSLDYEIMPSPWQDRDAYYEAGKYTYRVYHYLLNILTDYLNSIHGTKHSKRFWQIIIGPWLLHYIQVLYDRYYCLREALKSYYPIETISLNKNCYVIPTNTLHFIKLCTDDFYNLQLYTMILKQLGIEAPSKKLQIETKIENPLKGIKYYFNKCFYAISLFLARKRKIVLWDIYLNYAFIFKYILSSKFLCFPILFNNYFDSYTPSTIVADERRLNFDQLTAKDEFTRILIKTLPNNFPYLYLESFRLFFEQSLRRFKGIPKILMSSTGWFLNERLKFLAAYWAEKGTVLCGYQHGGLYGTSKCMPLEDHEIEIVDKYYTWGWRVKNNDSIRPLPNPKISFLRNRENIHKPWRQFLFVGNTHPRYLYRFFNCPLSEMFDGYMEWRIIFLRTLTESNRQRILLRLQLKDWDRNQRDHILREFPGIKIDNHELDFLAQLEKSQIIIIDHPVTTMLESLARNRPTILFWNPCYWELRDEAAPFFEELANAKVWHKDPISAAEFLNNIARYPLKWWNDPATQSARETFINQFAYGDKNWSKIWWNETKEILRPQ